MTSIRWIMAAALWAVPCIARADIGSCFLIVDQHVYLDGECSITTEKDGSFTIGTGGAAHNHARYSAQVNIDPMYDKADASWNGVNADSQDGVALGILKRDGGCWTNDRAKICTWKLGKRPETF